MLQRCLLAIDPGHSPGLVMLDANGAEVWSGQTWPTFDFRGACVIEKPTTRPGHPRPNDVLDLAITFGMFAQHAIVCGNELYAVTPSRWKGSLPKEIHHRQVDAEAKAIPQSRWGHWKARKQTDVMDAYALALWARKMLLANNLHLFAFAPRIG